MFFASLALIIILGILFGKLSLKLGLPAIFGMIIVGMIIGPFAFNLIDDKILSLSAEIKKIALLVLILQAGISLNYKDINQVKSSALLTSFIPSTLELITVAFFVNTFFKIGLWPSLMCGCIVAASSPSVIVPKMLQIKKEGLDKHKLTEILISATSLEGIYLILLFNIIVEMHKVNTFESSLLINIPIALISGIILGFLVSVVLYLIFTKIKLTTSQKTLTLLAMGFLCVSIESLVAPHFNVSGLISVAVMGLIVNDILDEDEEQINLIRASFTNIWTFVQVILFVLVGASISFVSLYTYGVLPLLVIIFGLIVRIGGFFISDFNGGLTLKEKIFGAGAFTPKATVQAALASTPLSLGIASGELIQTIALMSIIIAAPIGGVWIEKMKSKLLI